MDAQVKRCVQNVHVASVIDNGNDNDFEGKRLETELQNHRKLCALRGMSDFGGVEILIGIASAAGSARVVTKKCDVAGI